MILGPTRRLAAFVALLTASTALMVPGSAGGEPRCSRDPRDVDGAYGRGRARQGRRGLRRRQDLRRHARRAAGLGVERAIELPTIGAVAVTAELPVVDRLDTLPGVVAVEPQRRLVSYLYASKKQINAIGMDQPSKYTTVGPQAGLRPVRA